jgi:hypothetical protein
VRAAVFQPGLSARTCDFGLAEALAEPRAPVTADDVDELAHARELEVIAGRPAIIGQILALA